MSQLKTDWIVVEQETMAGLCRRCGARQQVTLPIAVDDWLKASKAFQDTHKLCLPQASTRKAIFLDIDGVLAGNHVLGQIWTSHVALLNRIWRATGAGLVFSTSWRESFNAEELGEMLRDRGLLAEVPILGATPILVLGTESETGLVIAVSRWKEIAAWLGEHPEIETFAILDDTIFEDFPAENTVQCSPARGLDDSEAARAITILGEVPR